MASSPLIKKILALQKKGLSQVKIGAKLGYSQSYISTLLKKAGIPSSVVLRWRERKAVIPRFDDDGFDFPEPYHVPNERVRKFLIDDSINAARFHIMTLRETGRKGRHLY